MRARSGNVLTDIRVSGPEPDETCELLAHDALKAEALRRGLPEVDEFERAADAAKALADPTRLARAFALRGAESACCVCSMAFIVGRQDKIVFHHVRQLRGAGLVHSRKAGAWSYTR